MQSLLEGTALQKKDAGQITGTNADLRKLSMKESMRILKGYGVTESEIKGHQLYDFHRSVLRINVYASHGSTLLKVLHRTEFIQLLLPAQACPDGSEYL